MLICEKYNCSISPEFCARRYQKALDNPNDASMLTCRECGYGKEVHGNGAFKPVVRTYKHWEGKESHPCPQCGMETREKLCVRCKEETEMAVKPDGNNFYQPKEKTCKDCGKKYQPTSNAQVRCSDCAEKHKAKKDNLRVSKATPGHIGEHRRNLGKTAEPGAKAERLERTGSHKAGGTGSIPAPATKDNGKHWLGQMLYISDLLDKQINEAIETGRINTKTILDCRFRLGAMIRGSLP